MKRGQRYRVVYLIPGVHRKHHEFVADFLDESDLEYSFSGRPEFGTTSVEKEHVHEIWETDRPISHPVIYRGETRVL
jgi:hypothetical protein